MIRTYMRIMISRGYGWRIHCGVEVTESSANKHHTLLHAGAYKRASMRGSEVTVVRTLGRM
jgi:hypothetical protein